MGTFSASKIVTARDDYRCEEQGQHTITAGEPYLRYQLGLKSSIKVCMYCAVTKHDRYDCAAIREYIEQAA